MALALVNIFDDAIVQNIQDFIPDDPPDPFDDFANLLGTVQIYRTKHYVTHTGGPEGGFVYFYKEREAGWYRWSRTWGEPPSYEKIETGVVLMICYPNGLERIGLAPDNWDDVYNIDPEVLVIVADDETMQNGDM